MEQVWKSRDERGRERKGFLGISLQYTHAMKSEVDYSTSQIDAALCLDHQRHDARPGWTTCIACFGKKPSRLLTDKISYSSSTSSTLGAACACRLVTCPFVAVPVPFVVWEASIGLASAFSPFSPFFDFLDFFAFLSYSSYAISFTNPPSQ